MKLFDKTPDSSTGTALDGFAARLAQVIAHTGVNQTEFARRIGASPGFISDVVRGNKKPGAEFLCAVRTVFGISVDWLLTGEGAMTGGAGINLELLRTIRLQIAVARAAVMESNPTASTLLILIRDGRLQETEAEPEIALYLEQLALGDPDTDLALELYNGHFWTQDVNEQHRNLLAAAIAHFEARKPVDRLAALSRAAGTTVQVNISATQRNAGRDYFER